MQTRNSCPVSATLVTVVFLVVFGPLPARAGDPPVITQHPASQTVCAGADVSFTVVVTGGDLSYQWRKDDESIDGATSDTLVLSAVTVADAGNYDVLVTNPYGSATSGAATLMVDAGPEVLEHPLTQEVCVGGSVTLGVTLATQATTNEDAIGSTGSSGSGSRMRGNYYHVDTATTLTRIEHYLDISDSGQLVFFVYQADNLTGPYTLIAEDTVADSGTGQGYHSSNALAVPLQAGKYYIIGAAWPAAHTYYWNYSHPHATTFGLSLSGFAYSWQDPLPDPPPTPSNSSAYMQRLTTSNLALTYQWRKDDQDIPGGAGPQYTIDSMSSAHVGDYDVVVANQCGDVASNTATLTLAAGVTITQDPNDQSVCAGASALFAVVAQGPGLSYQWRKDGEDLADATGDTHAIEAVTPEDAGDYDVVVSNACASVASAAAMLAVPVASPTITQQPADYFACQGQPITFTVLADGTDLHYQWRKDGQDIPDATDASYTIDVVATEDVGLYEVVVSTACGTVTSDAATLEVDLPVSITTQPAGAALCLGDQCQLDVVAAGTGLSYQWRKDGENIPDATGQTYAISPATFDDTGSYDVTVTNNCGEVISAAATVTVVGDPLIDAQPTDQTVEVGAPLTLSVELDLASFPPNEDSVGMPAWSSSGPRLRGNAYEVWQTTALTRIEHYLDITESSALVFFVYEFDAELDGYALVLEDTVFDSGTGLGFYASNPIELTLEAGKYYLVGAAWSGDHVYYWEENAHPQPTAFGQTVSGFATYYQYPLPAAPLPTSSHVWCQRLTTVTTVASCQWRKNGADIPGATAETYSVPAVTAADAGIYEVIVTNACGSVVSDPATVVVFWCEPLPSPVQLSSQSQPRIYDP